MKTQLDHFARRARSYWYMDGLPEILVGVLLLLMALISFGRSNAVPGSPLARTISTANNLLLTIGLGAGIWFIQRQKERSTYPRTGKVVHQAMPARKMWLRLFISVGVFILITLALIASFFISPSFRGGLINAQLWLPLGISAFFGAVLIAAARDGIKRFYVFGGLSLITGFGLWWYTSANTLSTRMPSNLLNDPWGPMPPELSTLFLNNMNQAFTEVAILTGILGCAFLISGIISRVMYLRQNPLSMDE